MRLERVFARCFETGQRTRLLGGAQEPLYQPAPVAGECHTLYYRQDYFASALHEVAHWCMAGTERRQQVDFGYWYAPDGRTAELQQAFEKVEYKPQALEWYFAKACSYHFQVSVDNLDTLEGDLPDTRGFRRRVFEQVMYWQRHGLPARADVFYRALCREFATATEPRELQFSLDELHS